MADDKQNGKHAEETKRAEDTRRVDDTRRVEEHKRAEEHRHADDKKNGGAKSTSPEDMTPVPTQTELDERAGEVGKQEKADREKVAASRKQEDLTPVPTQAEADDTKAKLFNTTVEEDKKRREEYAKHEGKVVAGPNAAKDGEDLTPTPTQAELDAVKQDVMYMPEGSGDPQKTAHSPPASQPGQHRRQIEANQPRAGYETRAAAPVKAEAE